MSRTIRLLRLQGRRHSGIGGFLDLALPPLLVGLVALGLQQLQALNHEAPRLFSNIAAL